VPAGSTFCTFAQIRSRTCWGNAGGTALPLVIAARQAVIASSIGLAAPRSTLEILSFDTTKAKLLMVWDSWARPGFPGSCSNNL
jgi:hypothetical protein